MRTIRLLDWLSLAAMTLFLAPFFILVGAWQGAVKYVQYATAWLERSRARGAAET